MLELHRSDEEESILEIAEHCLSELAQRSMVKVQVDEFSGKIKSCQLHDLMRDICLSKGKEENFLKIIPFKNENEPMSLISLRKSATTGLTRRLSINADLPDDNYFLLKHETTEHVRSALFFTTHLYYMSSDDALNSLFKNFKFLKILQLENFDLKMKLCKAIGNLVHLRYLSLRNSELSELPSTISKLKFLQTLDIKWHFILHLSIPDGISKLEQLRHLYLPRWYKGNTHLRLSSLKKLEVLKNFDSHVYDVRDLFQLTNLRKLAATLWLTWEDFNEVVSYLTSDSNRLNDSSFCIYYEFCSEEELFLLRKFVGCHHLRSLELYGHVSKLPEQNYFSLSLTKLTLNSSGLEEDPMATLEKLPRLKILSLHSNAFIGKEMRCSYQGFLQLRTLEFRYLKNIEDWRVDEGSMSNLLCLNIDDCKKLNMIPDGLRFVTTIQKLEILNMPKAFLHKLQSSDGEPGEDFFKISHISSVVFWDYHT
ncbi:hypothetical protein BUALT_Bualt14G0060300 [Buddleja alternifolia]|uniref:Uncharacterized protein n=1 Tax=Buddleja alternifolia TaxID=168488 RepID=A0AAV6WI66_9LAMI|nr:hypothetical protein BUALT_Bualt14G0060300 [Buddleja alternifolia]